MIRFGTMAERPLVQNILFTVWYWKGIDGIEKISCWINIILPPQIINTFLVWTLTEKIRLNRLRAISSTLALLIVALWIQRG